MTAVGVVTANMAKGHRTKTRDRGTGYVSTFEIQRKGIFEQKQAPKLANVFIPTQYERENDLVKSVVL